MVKAAELAPKRWLDVGAGHGHFCVAARAELPGTAFDGLDFSESIDEAEAARLGRHRVSRPVPRPRAGRSPAATTRVSMSHYLEHTLDPRAEIDAARTALAPSGCLLIEVPDPEFWLGRCSAATGCRGSSRSTSTCSRSTNLDKLLRERGFEPIGLAPRQGAPEGRLLLRGVPGARSHRAQPHLPWRWRGGAAATWRVIAWTIGAPLILGGVVIDNAIGPLLRRAKVSNTYRVLAIKQK